MKLQEIINQNRLVLIDFYAPWCGPCKIMEPILEELKSKVGERARIIKIDVDQNRQAAVAFQIRSVPTLVLFKEGALIWRQSGISEAGQLTQLIETNR